MRTIAALLLAGILLPAAPAAGFRDPGRRAKLEKAFPEIEKIFERYANGRGTPGLVFGIVIDGEVAHVKTYGVRERETKAPVTPGTVFRIASMTKSFTALAMLKLRDEGKLSLDDLVSKWIPEFSDKAYPTSDSAPVRLRQLLTHGAGFPEDNPWGDQQLGVSDEMLTAWLKRGIPYSTAPDTEYEYSNYGFALAGRVIAKASGRSYREYVEKEILAPLGMKSSTFEASAVPADVRAVGYRRLPGGAYAVEPSLPHGAFGAMGGLLTSAQDLGKYVGYMLSAWPPRDAEEQGPVRRSSVREMQRVWRTSDFSVSGPLRASAGGYGYGLRVSQDCRLHHIVGHGGGLPGFGSYMSWLPEYAVGVFALANLTYSGPGGLMPEVYEAFRKTGGLEPRKLPVTAELANARDGIVSLWKKWDDKQAESLAADNLFKDTPAATRREEIEKLKKNVGECRPSGEMDPENRLSARFRMKCERGSLDVVFTLAPTMPPSIQFLQFAPVQELEPAAKAAVVGVAELIGSFSEEKLKALASASGGLLEQQAEMQTAGDRFGKCTVGPTLRGDGRTAAMVRLECERGPVDVIVRLDGDGKVTQVNLVKPAEATCGL
jgi:CubicO group peptidase (beta-lactamase class C family)